MTAYDRMKAIEAQRKYCAENEIPTMGMAPTVDGYCEHCGANIYAEGLISVEAAGKSFITSCPNCRHSFLD